MITPFEELVSDLRERYQECECMDDIELLIYVQKKWTQKSNVVPRTEWTTDEVVDIDIHLPFINGYLGVVD